MRTRDSAKLPHRGRQAGRCAAGLALNRKRHALDDEFCPLHHRAARHPLKRPGKNLRHDVMDLAEFKTHLDDPLGMAAQSAHLDSLDDVSAHSGLVHGLLQCSTWTRPAPSRRGCDSAGPMSATSGGRLPHGHPALGTRRPAFRAQPSLGKSFGLGRKPRQPARA